MKACVVARRGSLHQTHWAQAFATGLRRHGWAVEISERPRPVDLMAVWGVRRQLDIAGQVARGGQVVVLERGYLGDRFAWTSVSLGGGLNGRAEFRGLSDDPARFEAHFGGLMKPWSRRTGFALLLGQVPGDMSLQAVRGDLSGWYARTAAQLAAAGWEVAFRPHPQAVARGLGKGPPDVPVIGGSLAQALAGAGLAVTFNSNAGVEAVLAGVPTLAADIGSMAWPVASHGVEEGQRRPPREAWAARLAWCQWTHAEIESGACWARIGEEEALACAS